LRVTRSSLDAVEVGYLALSVPVIGIGVALQSVGFRATIAGFVVLLVATTFAASPYLLRASAGETSEVAARTRNGGGAVSYSQPAISTTPKKRSTTWPLLIGTVSPTAS
jgi:hypothetical protein